MFTSTELSKTAGFTRHFEAGLVENPTIALLPSGDRHVSMGLITCYELKMEGFQQL